MTLKEAKIAMRDHLKIEAGRGDDYDTGYIHEIKGRLARVGWHSGVVTDDNPIASLSLVWEP